MVHSGFIQVARLTDSLDITRVPEVPALGNRLDMIGFKSTMLPARLALPPVPIEYQLPEPTPSRGTVQVPVGFIRPHTCVSL